MWGFVKRNHREIIILLPFFFRRMCPVMWVEVVYFVISSGLLSRGRRGLLSWQSLTLSQSTEFHFNGVVLGGREGPDLGSGETRQVFVFSLTQRWHRPYRGVDGRLCNKGGGNCLEIRIKIIVIKSRGYFIWLDCNVWMRCISLRWRSGSQVDEHLWAEPHKKQALYKDSIQLLIDCIYNVL
jgi:hypothetical protein